MYKLKNKLWSILLVVVMLTAHLAPNVALANNQARELSLELFEVEEVQGGARIKGFSDVGKNKVIKELIFPTTDGKGNNIISLGGNFKGKYDRIVLPKNLSTIEENVFTDVETHKLILPDGVKFVKEAAFKDSDIKNLKLSSGLAEIGEEAFSSKKMIIHNVNGAIKNMSKINKKAFKGSTISGDLILPGNIKTIGEEAFEDAQLMSEKLIFGEGIKKIDDRAFKNAKGSVKDLILPNTIETIGEEAFRGMKELHGKVVIPAGVKSIGFDSFKELLELDKFIYYPQTDRVMDKDLPKGPLAGIYELVLDPHNIFDHMGLYKYNIRVKDIENLISDKGGINPDIFQDKLNKITSGEKMDFVEEKILDKTKKSMNPKLEIVTHERFREDVGKKPFKFKEWIQDGKSELVNYRRGPENFSPFYGKPKIIFDSQQSPIKSEWLINTPTKELPGKPIMPNIDSEIKIKIPVNEIDDKNIGGVLNISLEDDLYRFKVKEATTNFAHNERVEVVEKNIASGDYQIELNEKLLRRDGDLVITLKGRLEFRRGVLNKLGIPTTIGEWVNVPGDTIKTAADLVQPLKVDAVIKTYSLDKKDSVDTLEVEDQLRLYSLFNPIMVEDFEEVHVFEGEEVKLPEKARIRVVANVDQDKGEQPITFYTGDWKIKWDKVDTTLNGCGERTVDLKATWDLNGINPLKDITNVFKSNIKEIEDLNFLSPKIKVRITKPEIINKNETLVLDTVEVYKGDKVDLDKKINVEYTDGKIKQLDIKWDTEINDYDMIQEIKGHVEDECGRKNVVKKVVFKENPNEIIEVKDSGKITVNIGEKPELPEKVTVIINAGDELEKNVVWDKVDTSKVGEYQVKGTVEDTTLKGNITVVVIDKSKEIVEVKDSGKITVNIGDKPKLPEKVTVVTSAGDELEKNVVWDKVDTSKVGEYQVKGTVEDTTLKGNITVVVVDKPVISKDRQHKAYMTGYNDGSIKPNGKMTRAEAARILFSVLDKKDINNYHNFKDVKGHWAETEIATLSNMGILKGYPDGSFKPNAKMTRAEVVTMLVQYKNLNTNVAIAKNDYTNHWAAKYIQAAIDQNIIKGYLDGSFRPDNNITRAEMASIINSMFDRCPKTKSHYGPVKQFKDLKKNDWFYDIMVEATNDHMARKIEGVYIWVNLGLFK